MKTLIIFFSRSGHNKQFAEELAMEISADIEEIIDQKPKGFIMSGWQSKKKSKTEIAPIGKDPKTYDNVIFITPLWFGGVPPAPRTYVEQHLEKIKSFAMVSVSGNGKDNERYIDELENDYSLNISPRLMISDKEF